MIYLKKFETTSQYNAYTADTANFIKPNVSLITETNTVEYNPDSAKPITDAVITCDSATYNGQTQVATNIVVTLSGETLINGTDYTVSGNEGGINAGNYTFTISGIGGYSDSKQGTFTINKANRTLSWVSNPSGVTSGSSITVEASASVGDGTIVYSSSDPTKASINGNVVSGVSVGDVTITATISEGTNYLSASTSYTLTVEDPYNGHAYVEIGGLKWATMNIGAESVTDNGLYFSWGNVEGHAKNSGYDFSDATYSGTSGYSLSGDIAADGGHDAARENWGGNWRLPTKAETTALVNATTSAWTTDYQGSGVNGLVLTDKTDSSKVLFFPAVGRYNGTTLNGEDSFGFCWSSSFNSATEAYGLNFRSSNVFPQNILSRYYGLTVRAVQS